MHPNSLANLRPAWKPGEIAPSPGPKGISRVEKALEIAQNASPKAARLIARAITNEDLPMGLRVRCAEYVLDKTLPSQKGEKGLLEALTGGVEWLELRFVKPGEEQKPAISTTYREEPQDASDDC